MDFSRAITKAALTNHAYDPQCEGDRAEYVARLIEISGKKTRIVDHVLLALNIEREDTWALEQLFELAAIFAMAGNSEARKAIYKRYHKKVINNFTSCGEEAILKMDGLKGLMHIAEVRGKALAKNPDEWEDGSAVALLQEIDKTLSVSEELKSASKNNSHIKKYYMSMKKQEQQKKERPSRSRNDYSIIKKRVNDKMLFPAPYIRDLSDVDFKKLADDFLEEKDKVKQERYMRVFGKRKYPYDFQPLLLLAKGPNNRADYRFHVVRWACRALRFFNAKEIRQFAIEKISKTNFPEDYLDLLIANYKKGDSKLLARIAGKYKNEDVVHNLATSYVDIYRANKTKECKKPLELLYEKLTCGLHRQEIVEILHENGVLSKKILKEMEFDSLPEIRELWKKTNYK